MGSFKAAVVQMRSGIDPAANIESLRALVGKAAAQGAVYVQTPEMTGAVQRNRAALEGVLVPGDRDAVAHAAGELARQHRIYLHLGSTAVKLGEGSLANRSFLFGPDGAELARYDKIHMFDVDLDKGESWRESSAYRPGAAATVVTLPMVTAGLAICYDLRFPQLFRAEAMAGAQMLTVPAAFTRQTGQAHWHVLLRARAIENGAYVVAAAQGGLHEDGRETFGHSLIVDPWGKIIAELDHDEPGVAIAEIDPAQSAAARARIPNLKNAREFQVVAIAAHAERERQIS
jgi:predicted amidohydrolase